VGNLGSADVRALTSMDKFGVPEKYPRGDPRLTPKKVNRKGVIETRLLTPQEWAFRFAATFKREGV
jgi:hypothetical protein